MARVYMNCAGQSQLSCVPHFNGRSTRGLLLCLAIVCLLSIFMFALLRVKQHSYTTKDTSQDTEARQGKHYGVVLDCGSSGTRVYVYVWPHHNGNTHELLKIQQLIGEDGQPVSKKVSPGLSSYGEKPNEASNYLEPLLKYAAQKVPREKHKETPLYILATAGMRMIPKNQQKAVFDDLKTDIPRLFDFAFSDTQAEIISGKQEGVYAWIAVNYVLGRFDHTTLDQKLSAIEPTSKDVKVAPHYRKKTVGMIDMGGGSVQIAFEISHPKDIPKNLLAEFNLGCVDSDKEHTYQVYVTTYLGFGANAAHKRYYKQLIRTSVLNNRNVNSTKRIVIGTSVARPILDPCLTRDQMDTFSFNKSTYHFKGVGDFKACEKATISLLNLTVLCPRNPCAISGQYQSKINFYSSEFYGFSEYWYSMQDVLGIGGKYNSESFTKEASDFCATKWSTLQDRYSRKLYPKADPERFRTQCFKSSWISVALHEGFKFPRNYDHFQSAQFIKGRDVQWTLGALLYRTRYLPLREIEERKQLHHHKSSWTVGNLLYNHYIIGAIVFTTAMVIIIYIKRAVSKPPVTMPRASSKSYLLLEHHDEEMTVKVDL